MPFKVVIDTRYSNNFRNPKINVDFFNSVKVNMKHDSVASTFEFEMDFDPNNQEHAEIACVSHMHEVLIYYVHDKPGRYPVSRKSGQIIYGVTTDELVLTGYMLSQSFTLAPKPELTQLTGYSKPGALEDCDVPVELYPLESNGLTFRQIVQKLISRFNFGFVVAASGANTVFVEKDRVDKQIEKSTAPESTNIKSYLTELATQKNLVLSHDEFGNLLITNGHTSKASVIATIDADNHPQVGYRSMRLVFNGQPMHSHITVVRQADDEGGNAAEYTLRNYFLPVAATFRPRVVTLSSGSDVTIQEAARNELAKELKNINLVIEMDRPVINNKVIRPNCTIMVKARHLFLYKQVQWFVEGVDMEGNKDGETATLTCVPVFCYNQANVKSTDNFFVDPHENLPRI